MGAIRIARPVLGLILFVAIGGTAVAQNIPPIEAEKTPLHWAAGHGLTGMASRLLQNGADLEAVDQFGRTALHYAVAFPDMVNLLIDAGIDVDATDVFGRTALHEALQYPETVSLLISAGADVYATDFMGDTPLERTLRFGTRQRNMRVINLLLDAGAGGSSR